VDLDVHVFYDVELFGPTLFLGLLAFFIDITTSSTTRSGDPAPHAPSPVPRFSTCQS
jgi:hypothetical protein